MTHTELVGELSLHTGIPKTKVSSVLKTLGPVVRDAVLSEEKVTLYGFGYFYSVRQRQRELFGGSRRPSGNLIRFKESRHGRRKRR